jgi:hypothetical protein
MLGEIDIIQNKMQESTGYNDGGKHTDHDTNRQC